MASSVLLDRQALAQPPVQTAELTLGVGTNKVLKTSGAHQADRYR